MDKKSYSEILKDPRWQKKRLEILTRDDWTCVQCKDWQSNLQVHHQYYVSGRDPWDYPEFCYMTLCEACHKRVKGSTMEPFEVASAMMTECFEPIFRLGSEIEEVGYERGDLQALMHWLTYHPDGHKALKEMLSRLP